MTRLTRPLLLFDGACTFCRAWIARWQGVIGERAECLPYQEAGPRAGGIAPEALARAVHLVEPGGRVSRGAEAVFRSLALTPRHGWGLALYRFVPGAAALSEACYAWIARHRPFGERVTRLVWGPHLVPPGDRLTSWLFLRALGAVYLIAFASLWSQVIGLMGRDGILPATQLLEAVGARYGPERFWLLPTLAWLGSGDLALHVLCAAGVAASLLLTLGIVPAASLAVAWALYLSLVSVAREFCGYQWDTLLLETGLLALFLAPWRRVSRPSSDPAPSRLARWALKALVFRLFFSSAVAKLVGGDPTWRDLTALEFHYQTQCLPPWTAWFMHHLPAGFQRLSAASMFAIEGLIPFLILAPRRVRFAAAWAMIGLQLMIAATGNYGFFNLLSIVLCVPLLDDGAWPWRWRTAAVAAQWRSPVATPPARGAWPRPVLRVALTTLLLLSLVPLVETLAWPTGWLGPLPAIERLLNPLRSINRYGLFSVMTTRRPEIVLEGSDDRVTWRELPFRWKPGDVTRRPGFVAPHQPRLDWQMWFAALSDVRREPWFVAFCERLLQGSIPVWRLLAPAATGTDGVPRPPRYLRAIVYDYRFTDAATRRATGAWWTRERLGPYCPDLTLEDGHLTAAPSEAAAP